MEEGNPAMSVAKPDSYWDSYVSEFDERRSHGIRLLELGVAEGDSLRRWLDFFVNGHIVGLDRRIRPGLDGLSDRLHLYEGSQDDTELLSRAAADCAPDGFDLIIDDCAHVGAIAQVSFWHLFCRHLKAGGVYVIEDWGTGYLPTWRDGARLSRNLPPTPRSRSKPSRLVRATGRRLGIRGATDIKSHQSGMVGLVKQIIDGVAERDIRRGDPNQPSQRLFIENVTVRPGMVLVYRGGGAANAGREQVGPSAPE
jgi:hypothetical protein